MNTVKADKIFREVESGRTIKSRPQLERAIDALGAEDILVIAEWGGATLSMMDGIGIIQWVADRSATVKILDKPWLDLTTPMGKGILAFLSVLAEDEGERITWRTNEGRQIAIAKGMKFGRKPKLTAHQLDRNRMDDGDTWRAIARDLGVATP